MTVRKRTLAHLARILASSAAVGASGCEALSHPDPPRTTIPEVDGKSPPPAQVVLPPEEPEVYVPPDDDDRPNIVCDPMPRPHQELTPQQQRKQMFDQLRATLVEDGPIVHFQINQWIPSGATVAIAVKGAERVDKKDTVKDLRLRPTPGKDFSVVLTFRDRGNKYVRTFEVNWTPYRMWRLNRG